MAGRVEDREGVAAELPPLDRAYHIDFRLLSDRLAEIPDEVNGILKLFDGRRTLAEVLAQAEREGVAAAKVLARLWSEEIIRPAPATPAAPASRGDPPEAALAPKPAPDLPEGGAPETRPADWFTGPDAEPPPQASAAVGAAQPSQPASTDGASAAPRIVRFPARPKAPRSTVGEPTAARPLPPAPVVRRPVRPVRAAHRPSPAVGMRRRSATALLLAASVLAAVGIWRVVASRAPEPGESGSPSSAAAPGSQALPGAPAAAPDRGAKPAGE